MSAPVVALLALTVAPAGVMAARVTTITFESAEPGAILREALFPAAEGEHPPADPAITKVHAVEVHTVQPNETVSEIAARHGLRLGTLIAFNGVRDARSIPVGKKLLIPNADGLRYVVRTGDSLSRIARRYGVTVNALRDWNDLQTDLIRADQQLFVPGASLSAEEIDGALGKLFVHPTRGRLTSGFGLRISPFARVQILHNGIDIANWAGTPVNAARSGRVTSVDVGPVYGRAVVISHGGGYQTLYAHLASALVRSGQTVSQGQQIGTMGSTGESTGPHLHFTVFRNGVPINPLSVLP